MEIIKEFDQMCDFLKQTEAEVSNISLYIIYNFRIGFMRNQKTKFMFIIKYLKEHQHVL